MKLNRSLIKSQARALIKGHVWALFLVTIVVAILSGSGTIISSTIDIGDLKQPQSPQQFFNQYSNGTFDEEFSKDFNDAFDDFFEQSVPQKSNSFAKLTILATILSVITTIASIAQLFLLPLSVTLLGVYVMLVHGNKMKVDDSFKYTFKYTFNSTYWNKLLCVFVQNIIVILMSFLFIVPGIIFYYRYYFANIILADNPNLSAKQAVKLSIKMTDGHKSELFALSLSFIGWAILTAMTFGILSIYTMPYVITTKALYYENFKARAFAEGALTENDFVENTFDVSPDFAVNTNEPQPSQYYVPPQPVAEPVQSQAATPAPAPAPTPVQPAENATKAVLSVEEATSGNADFGTGLENDYYNTNV